SRSDCTPLQIDDGEADSDEQREECQRETNPSGSSGAEVCFPTVNLVSFFSLDAGVKS
uniref:Homeodomain leucine zipper protein n=1 Tax=Steinernema glaseri TaxID=37863 RepID=A0A1I7YHV6_9BILA